MREVWGKLLPRDSQESDNDDNGKNMTFKKSIPPLQCLIEKRFAFWVFSAVKQN